MSGPLLLIVGPLLPAAVIFVGLRRWPRAAAVCGFLSALLLRFLIAAVDLQPAAGAEGAFLGGDEFIFLGRSLLLTGGLRQLLLTVYSAGAILFLLSAIWSQGPDFVPAGLATLSPLAFALMVNPLSFGAVALLLAAALLAALVQAQRPGSTLPALRYLLLAALSVPVFLVAGWMLDSQQLVFGGAIWRLLLLGATLLLAGFPFHIWVRPLLNESHPLTAVFVLAPVQIVILTFVWRWLQENPNLLASTQLGAFLGWSGAVTALVAALLAFSTRDPRRLLGCLVLADMAATLICLSQGVAGIEQAWGLLLLRFLSLTLAAVGLQWAAGAPEAGSDADHERLARNPLAAALFGYGALSLVGLPLTPGFAGRWAAVGVAGAASIWWALLLLLALAGGVAGVLRTLAPVVDRLKDEPQPLALMPWAGRRLSGALLAGAVLFGLILSLYPWPLLNLVSRLNELF